MLARDTISEMMATLAADVATLHEGEWYLAGGTALALQIGHRESVDLDYFTAVPFSVESLREVLNSLWAERDFFVTYEAPNTLWCTVEGVQISFIYRPVALLNSIYADEEFRLASLQDITVMKLLAICSREEYKDYFDLACLSKETDIRSWVHWWETAYPSQDVTSWLLALGNYDTVPEIPLRVTDAYKSLSVSGTLTSTVRELTAYIQAHT